MDCCPHFQHSLCHLDYGTGIPNSHCWMGRQWLLGLYHLYERYGV